MILSNLDLVLADTKEQEVHCNLNVECPSCASKDERFEALMSSFEAVQAPVVKMVQLQPES